HPSLPPSSALTPPPPTPTLLLYTTLFRSRADIARCEYNYTPPLHFAVREGHLEMVRFLLEQGADATTYRTYPFQDSLVSMAQDRDRKSTRLNSSHRTISYAVFCLKKNKIT